MVVQSTSYKKKFPSKNIEREKIIGKTWVMQKHTKARKWWKIPLHYTKIRHQLSLKKKTDSKVDNHTGGKWFIYGPKRRYLLEASVRNTDV